MDRTGQIILVCDICEEFILRTAVDRALLQEESAVLEGVFVLVSEGTPA